MIQRSFFNNQKWYCQYESSIHWHFTQRETKGENNQPVFRKQSCNHIFTGVDIFTHQNDAGYPHLAYIQECLMWNGSFFWTRWSWWLFLFQEALQELGVSVQLRYCENGALPQCSYYLANSGTAGDSFLDRNMPRKAGSTVLEEIRVIKIQRHWCGSDLHFYEPEIVHLLYESGADRYA